MNTPKIFAICTVMMLFVGASAISVEISRSKVSELNDHIEGSGTEGDPYMIHDVHDLQNISLDLNAHYALANDIDASETSEWNWNGTAFEGFEPIGTFTGSLDGRGFNITDLFIERSSTDNVGLFGNLGEDGIVANTTLVNGTIAGKFYTGGLVGYNSGLVKNSSFDGDVTGVNYGTGGIVGWNIGEVGNSYFAGNVTGDGYYVGGIVGVNWGGVVYNSHYNMSAVKINGEDHMTIGGLYGTQYDDWLSNDLHLDIEDYSATLAPSGDYYDISSVDGMRDLLGFACRVGYDFRLSADIDLSGSPGLYIPYLAANFDGNGYTMSNLYINHSFAGGVGLFGYNSRGIVKDILVTDVNITGYAYVGGVVGWNDGEVVNSSAQGYVLGDWYSGVLVGYNRGNISESFATGTVTGHQSIGGLVGFNDEGSIDDSDAVTNVTANRNVGGFVGENSGHIQNSYSIGNVTGGTPGGLIGSNEGTVLNSFYNVDETLIHGDRFITRFGILGGQFHDWISNDLILDIDDYSDTLVPIDGSYGINDVQGLKDLLGFAHIEEYAFLLTDDIDLVDDPGLYIPYLAGDFDGYNHTVSDLDLDQTFSSELGLFGYNSGGTIENIGLTDVSINGGWYTGGLVGRNKGTVHFSSVTGSVTGGSYVGGLIGSNEGTATDSWSQGYVTGNEYVGGLIGCNWNGVVERSFSEVCVAGDECVGGLVGWNYEGIMGHSFATGNVEGDGDVIGGFVGLNFKATVHDSYSTGNVTGIERVGGLIGMNYIGTVYNTYSVGKPTGDSDIGGLIGYNILEVEVSNSFWDVETSDIDESEGGTGMTTAQMTDITTFNDAGWDVGKVPSLDYRRTDDIWNMIDQETYPFFSWESLPSPGHHLELLTVGDGHIIPQSGNYRVVDGVEVPLETSPSSGCTFSHWSGDVPVGDEESESITIVMDDDKTLTAHFVESEETTTYELAVNIEGEGTTEPAVGNHTYDEGTEVDLEAFPSFDWTFSHWSGDLPAGDEESESITIVMDDDKTLTAHFVEVEDVVYPTIEILSPEDGTVFETGTVSIEWVSEAGTYPISRHEIRSNNGDWLDIGNVTEHTFTDLEDGEYDVSVKVVDIHGNEALSSVGFTVHTEDDGVTTDGNGETPGFGLLVWLIPVAIAIPLVTVLYILKKRSKTEETPEEESTETTEFSPILDEVD